MPSTSSFFDPSGFDTLLQAHLDPALFGHDDSSSEPDLYRALGNLNPKSDDTNPFLQGLDSTANPSDTMHHVDIKIGDQWVPTSFSNAPTKDDIESRAKTLSANQQSAPRTGSNRNYKDILSFGAQFGFSPPSNSDHYTTGGDHAPGSAHYQGLAVDFRSRHKTNAQIDDFISKALAAGYSVEDARNTPSSDGGPHVHIQSIPFGGGKRYITGPGSPDRSALLQASKASAPQASPTATPPPARPSQPQAVGTIDDQIAQTRTQLQAAEKQNLGSPESTRLRQKLTQLLAVKNKMPRAAMVPGQSTSPTAPSMYAGAPVHEQLANTPGTLENAMRQLDGQVSWRSPQQREAVLKYLYRQGTQGGKTATPVISPHLLQSTANLLNSPGGGMSDINVYNHAFVNRGPDPRNAPLPSTLLDHNPIVPSPAMNPSEKNKIVNDIHDYEHQIHDLQAKLPGAPPSVASGISSQISDLRQKLASSFGNLGYETSGMPHRVGDPWYEYYKAVGDKAQATADAMVKRGVSESDYWVRKNRWIAAAVRARLTGGAPPTDVPLPVTEDMRNEYKQHLHDLSEEKLHNATGAAGLLGVGADIYFQHHPPRGKWLTEPWNIYGRPPGLPPSIANADDPYQAIEDYHPSDQEVMDWANHHADDLREDAQKTGGERFNELMDPLKPAHELLDAGVGHLHDLIHHYVTGAPIGDYMNNHDRSDENEVVNHAFDNAINPLIEDVMIIPKVWHIIGNAWSFAEDPHRTVTKFIDDQKDIFSKPFKKDLGPIDRLYATIHAVDNLEDLFDQFKDTKEGLSRLNITLHAMKDHGLSLGEADAIYRRIDDEIEKARPQLHGMQKFTNQFSMPSQAPTNSRVQRMAGRYSNLKNISSP